ncbi:MAG: M20/M25/M40 family metallo-hydrolase [Bacteroidetes bacterium]|nr:M20/M25/M40 family metallo-hydrolase [Bacteroidota bacterium]
MRATFTKLSLILLVLVSCNPTSKLVTTQDPTTGNLKKHIEFLADDKLEGRRTGTKGEELAREYIKEQFEAIGLTPKGTGSFPQAFTVNEGKTMQDGTLLQINGTELEKGKDYFCFPYSPNVSMEAMPAIAVPETDMPWFTDLKEILEENKSNPHFDLAEAIRSNAKKAAKQGATALFYYNSSAIDDKLTFDPKDRSEQSPIPVVYIKKDAAASYLSDKTASLKLKLTIRIGEKKRTGFNVVGYIDNNAPTTVILGAHFDHLGYGEDGNSRHASHDPAIHNGADDNASGTAALIELARKLKTSKATHNNYLFIAFSGEELGLYGSKHFTENPTIDLKSVNYMINMDMVGRLSDSSKVITIGGYGTSPEWSKNITPEYFVKNNADKKTAPDLVIRFDSSGTGPSDHTSFYRKDIPVLFYFTGLHSDYHKPTDDADRINYNGETVIVGHILKLVESLDGTPKLAFTKTREAQTTTSARFSVSMGIMPDYTFSGNGVRADGVSEGKPAQKAGLKAGDIVLQIGDFTISSLESYMQTLGKMKKGDKVKVKYKRGEAVLETMVEF